MNENDRLTVAHAQEVDSGERFQFGRNWSKFLESLNEAQIVGAEESLKPMLNVESLRDKSFIDVGSGSGLFFCKRGFERGRMTTQAGDLRV